MNFDKVFQVICNWVEKVVWEVGYLLQFMGCNVKCNEFCIILVIVLDICDFFFSEIICGIEVMVVNYGYLVLIGDCVY